MKWLKSLKGIYIYWHKVKSLNHIDKHLKKNLRKQSFEDKSNENGTVILMMRKKLEYHKFIKLLDLIKLLNS